MTGKTDEYESEVSRDELVDDLRTLEQQAREYKVAAEKRDQEVNRANYQNLETALGNLRLSLHPDPLATDECCPECGTARFHQASTGAPGSYWCERCESEFWQEGGDWYSCGFDGEPQLVETGVDS